jgi:hypothetical protein
VLARRDVISETLDSRRALLESTVPPNVADPSRYSTELPGRVADPVRSVKAQGLSTLQGRRNAVHGTATIYPVIVVAG